MEEGTLRKPVSMQRHVFSYWGSDPATAHLGLGDALSQIPEMSGEAIAEYQTAVQIRPDYASVVSERMKILRGAPSSFG